MIVPVNETDFADSLLHSLSSDFPDKHFEVYGMPSWAGIGDLKKNKAFPNITVHLTSAPAIDPNTPMAQYVRRIYTQVYAGKMSSPVYDGFETLFFYAGLLKKYGTHFNEQYGSVTTPHSFDIQPQTDKGGNVRYYENTRVVVNDFGERASKKK